MYTRVSVMAASARPGRALRRDRGFACTSGESRRLDELIDPVDVFGQHRAHGPAFAREHDQRRGFGVSALRAVDQHVDLVAIGARGENLNRKPVFRAHIESLAICSGRGGGKPAKRRLAHQRLERRAG